MIYALLFFLIQQPAATISGNLEVSGMVNAAGVMVDTVPLLPGDRTRVLTYLVGCDNCGAVSPFDDQRSFFVNLYGRPLTIQEVRCYTDSGSVSINLQRSGGTSVMLAADLACTPAGAKTSVFLFSDLQPEQLLDFQLVAADGVARRVMLSIKALLN